MSDIKKVVLAYSGGLDTSVIVRWLQETYQCEVVTFTADIGQGEEVEPARAKAQAMGVKEIYIEDLREEFARDFVFPMFRANTIYEGEYLLGTSIARPLIAKRLIEIANETGADAGNLEDPWWEPEEDMWRWSVSPETAPDKPTYVTLTYEKGDIVAIDGKPTSAAQVLEQLNKVAGDNGIGRLDLVENRYVGMKSRGCYETPAGTVMLRAHRAIESLTLDRESAHLKDSIMPKYAELIYNGYWWSPERLALQQLIDATQEYVNGEVRVKLYKGNVSVVGRRSEDSLFDASIATFEDDAGAYNQKDAEGFIRLNALRLRIAAKKGRRMQ